MSSVASVSVLRSPALLGGRGSVVAVLQILDKNGQGVAGKHLDPRGVTPVVQIGTSGAVVRS